MNRDKLKKKLQLIIDIGYDYDGYDNKEDLKKLIDELVSYANDCIKIIEDNKEKLYRYTPEKGFELVGDEND